MLPFIYAGAVSVIGVLMGKRLANAQKKPKTGRDGRLHSRMTLHIVAHHVLEESHLILATEEVPMDNRFGNKPLSSEHEFSQTATIGLELGDGRRLSVGAKTTLWRLLESKAESELAKSLGIEVGSQINRRVRLRFATDPGQFVRYRVVWQQQSQRGMLEIQAGEHRVQLPYLVAYGLSHTVESLPGESIPSSKNHPLPEEQEEAVSE